jgi:hypothetical protein
MKRLVGVFVLSCASAMLLGGCVPINYSRSVTVHKDANGVVQWTEERETITEAHQESPKTAELKDSSSFKYLK